MIKNYLFTAFRRSLAFRKIQIFALITAHPIPQRWKDGVPRQAKSRENGFEREGDEGITGNRKQTFGFIERGIAKRYKYLIAVVPSAKQKSPCFLSILSSLFRPRRIFVLATPFPRYCVTQRHPIFILGKNTNNNRETASLFPAYRLSNARYSRITRFIYLENEIFLNRFIIIRNAWFEIPSYAIYPSPLII